MQRNCLALTLMSLGLATAPTLAFAQAYSLKDMPDEVRATIIKEMSRKNLVKQEQTDTDALEKQSGIPDDESYGPRRAGTRGGGCKMDVGSQDQPSRGQRRVTTVITAPVVQICK